MRAAKLSSAAWQTGEARRIHINPGVDLAPGCWANKSQRRQYNPSTPWLGNGKRRSPDRGKPGLLLVPLGERVKRNSPHVAVISRFMRSLQIVSPYASHKENLLSSHDTSAGREDRHSGRPCRQACRCWPHGSRGSRPSRPRGNQSAKGHETAAHGATPKLKWSQSATLLRQLRLWRLLA